MPHRRLGRCTTWKQDRSAQGFGGAAAVATIGTALQASSYSLGQLIAGRILSGVGNGGVNSIVPVWQSEVAKPKSRGKNVVSYHYSLQLHFSASQCSFQSLLAGSSAKVASRRRVKVFFNSTTQTQVPLRRWMQS
jgi:MFS family permease